MERRMMVPARMWTIRSSCRPGSRALIALVAAIGWLAVAAGSAAAATPAAATPGTAAVVEFGRPTITATFGQGIEFRQPVDIVGAIRRAELLVDYPRATGPEVRVIPATAGSSTLRYTLETATAALLPNTSLAARWRIVGEDGSVSLGPRESILYQDTRFAWQSRQSGVMRVHWYEGGAAFGTRALEIGTRAIDAASRLLGVAETEPVDFFVYASQDAFYGALGPGTRENVGGQANAEIRTLFALITPGEINLPWVEIVIPHELTHLVFDTAVSNPYHFPPRWLNEGLAVYLAQGYDASDRASVERAAADRSLMPLDALAHQFPTTRDRFALAYSESVSAVDYLVRTHGQEALVSLIRSYAAGVTDDVAFEAALGRSSAGFDAEWRASLSAREPVVHGPRPAPPGPLPLDGTGSSSVGSASPPADDGQPDPQWVAGLAGSAAVAIGVLLVVNARRSRLVAASHIGDGRPSGAGQAGPTPGGGS
jgi:hypothetical protein